MQRWRVGSYARSPARHGPRRSAAAPHLPAQRCEVGVRPAGVEILGLVCETCYVVEPLPVAHKVQDVRGHRRGREP